MILAITDIIFKYSKQTCYVPQVGNSWSRRWYLYNVDCKRLLTTKFIINTSEIAHYIIYKYILLHNKDLVLVIIKPIQISITNFRNSSINTSFNKRIIYFLIFLNLLLFFFKYRKRQKMLNLYLEKIHSFVTISIIP